MLFVPLAARCSGEAGFLERPMFIMKLLWMALFAGIYGAALAGVSLLLRLTSLTADRRKRLRRWLSSSWRWIYWNFSVFARLWHSSNAVPCVSDWLSLHKKVKLCCPMLETIKYDFSVLVSLQPSCNEYRRSDCRRRPSSAFHVATTRSHAQRNFFFQLAHPDFSNYDLSITQKPRAIKKINWKALLRRPRARASR